LHEKIPLIGKRLHIIIVVIIFEQQELLVEPVELVLVLVEPVELVLVLVEQFFEL
jgi:hypothetical protein